MAKLFSRPPLRPHSLWIIHPACADFFFFFFNCQRETKDRFFSPTRCVRCHLQWRLMWEEGLMQHISMCLLGPGSGGGLTLCGQGAPDEKWKHSHRQQTVCKHPRCPGSPPAPQTSPLCSGIPPLHRATTGILSAVSHHFGMTCPPTPQTGSHIQWRSCWSFGRK